VKSYHLIQGMRGCVANYKYHMYKGIAFGVSVFVVKIENRNFDSDFRWLV